MSKQLESITYFTCLREVLSLSLNEIEGINENEKRSLSNFIISEASDYEILHFTVTGKFPEEKYNSVNESILVEEIKNDLYEHSFELCDFLGENSFENLVESLVPLSDYGLSSSKSILEHLTENNILQGLLSEGAKEKLAAMRKAKEAKHQAALENARRNRDVIRNRQDPNEFVSANNFMKKRDKNSQEAKNNELAGYRKDKELRSNTAASEDDEVDIKTYLKTRGQAAGHNIAQGAKNLGTKIKKAVTPPKQTKLGAGLEDDEVDTKTYLKTQGQMALHNAGEAIKKGAESASQAAKKASDFVNKNKKTLGGIALAAALLYGGYKTYKRFFSKAARACASKSGAEKTACMEAFKKNAIKAQISDLRRSLTGCKSASNPQKCQSAINAKIQKLQAKLV